MTRGADNRVHMPPRDEWSDIIEEVEPYRHMSGPQRMAILHALCESACRLLATAGIAYDPAKAFCEPEPRSEEAQQRWHDLMNSHRQ